jgi:pullulanase
MSAARFTFRALFPLAATLAAGAALADARLADCNAATHARTLVAAPATAPVLAAEGIWFGERTLRWPGAAPAAAGARYRLLHSARGQLVALPGAAATGVDTAVALRLREGALSDAVAQRFKYVAAGATLELPAGTTAAQLKALHQGQLLLAQEDAQGRVLRATRTQHPAALDALYADAAERHTDYGATPTARRTAFRIWAPTAQAVALCLHRQPQAAAGAVHTARRDAASGAWSLALPGNLSGASRP